jgi:hypothetical protein
LEAAALVGAVVFSKRKDNTDGKSSAGDENIMDNKLSIHHRRHIGTLFRKGVACPNRVGGIVEFRIKPHLSLARVLSVR